MKLTHLNKINDKINDFFNENIIETE